MCSFSFVQLKRSNDKRKMWNFSFSFVQLKKSGSRWKMCRFSFVQLTKSNG